MRKDNIRQLDLYLVNHKGLLTKEEEKRYIELVVEGYGVPEPEDGQAEEPLPLELLKLHKKLQLKVRDSSTEVNRFTINGQTHWYTPDLRANLRNATDALEDGHRDSAKFKDIVLPVPLARAAIFALERYAADCQNKTDEHAAAIEALETAEAVEAYDFTTGYPEPLNFDQIEG